MVVLYILLTSVPAPMASVFAVAKSCAVAVYLRGAATRYATPHETIITKVIITVIMCLRNIWKRSSIVKAALSLVISVAILWRVSDFSEKLQCRTVALSYRCAVCNRLQSLAIACNRCAVVLLHKVRNTLRTDFTIKTGKPPCESRLFMRCRLQTFEPSKLRHPRPCAEFPTKSIPDRFRS